MKDGHSANFSTHISSHIRLLWRISNEHSLSFVFSRLPLAENIRQVATNWAQHFEILNTKEQKTKNIPFRM